MEPVKVGQTLYCANCGVELLVVKACSTDCKACKPICCDKPMSLKGSEATLSECCGA